MKTKKEIIREAAIRIKADSAAILEATKDSDGSTALSRCFGPDNPCDDCLLAEYFGLCDIVEHAIKMGIL